MIIGTAQFGLNYGITNNVGKIKNQDLKKIFTYVKKKNLFHFDTAFGYGDAHKRICSLIKNERKKYIITTKVKLIDFKNYNFLEKKIKLFKKKFNQQKVNLLCHDESIILKKNIQYLKNLKKLKLKKIVDKIGVSFYSKNLAYKALQDSYLDIIQISSNILDQRILDKKFLKFKNKIFCRSIFLQGILIAKNTDFLATRFKNKLKKIQLILDKYKLSNIDLCFYYIIKIARIRNFIVGFQSLQELKLLYISYSKVLKMKVIKKLAFEIKKINCSRKNIIDPRKWKKIY